MTLMDEISRSKWSLNLKASTRPIGSASLIKSTRNDSILMIHRNTTTNKHLSFAYEKAYTELGSKIAGSRPDQTLSGENEDVDEAIKRQLKIAPEDDYEFTLALKFNLATNKGKPVWKSNSYQFKAGGKYHAGQVVVEQGKITYIKSF